MYVSAEDEQGGERGTYFRAGPFMSTHSAPSFAASALPAYTDASAPHLTVTSSALFSLMILRDNFKRLDRSWLAMLIGTETRFTATLFADDTDLRTSYCALVVCTLLNDCSGMDVSRAVAAVVRIQDSTTFCAVAVLHLVPPDFATTACPTHIERHQTVHRLLHAWDDLVDGFASCTDQAPDAWTNIPHAEDYTRLRRLQVYEDGYGHSRSSEALATELPAQSGTTYCDATTLYLVTPIIAPIPSAALVVMGEKEQVDVCARACFLVRCQHNFGAIVRAQDKISGQISAPICAQRREITTHKLFK
ncbi:hypothetical protein K488DRAFT_91650 [Vararia minispora EC-137]|uniref:Uncharacterized protein n=1 Tax=Vararia minispora EC-137 TaxID=1314806 RepID=A0ACB8Q5D8_9AGAM|nr:hypothetical protein K488DRAFT_91650 [Vararia minispora EC-137]